MRRVVVIASVTVVALGIVAYVGVAYFAPKASTHVDEAATVGTVERSGAFHDGLPGHHAAGTVKLVRASDGSYELRLEAYEATAGPDVYFYLTPKEHADTAADVEGAGVKLAVPNGSGDGQATLRGNFNVPLPRGVDPAADRGISVWCRRYDAFFGYAALS